MKNNFTKYLMAVFFAGALITPLATITINYLDNEIEFNKTVMPMWFKQATLLLAKIKADSNLTDHIQQYRDEFSTLNDKYDIEAHIGLAWKNEYMYQCEFEIYLEIRKNLSL